MHRMRRLAYVVAAGLVLATAAPAAAGDPIKGAGSSFAEDIINAWAKDVGNVSYEGIGSGSGRAGLVAGNVDFAGSDVPAKAEERTEIDKRGGTVHVPVTAGGLAIVYNVGELESLKLSGPTLAAIFSGKVKKWNDPAITLDNGAPGPDRDITVFVRSDKSGSTGILTGYLSAAGEGQWNGGQTEQFPAGAGQQGVEGSSGMTKAVGDTDGGVGYVDHGDARSAKLSETRVINSSGNARPPDAASVSAALDQAKTNADGTVEMNFTAGGQAYPISSVSYVITTGQIPGPKHETMKAFLDHALGAGQGKADGLGYAPLPAKLQAFAQEQASKIKAG